MRTLDDLYTEAVETHVGAIVLAAEQCASASVADAAELVQTISQHEKALHALGLTPADIYSWVNRSPVPNDH